MSGFVRNKAPAPTLTGTGILQHPGFRGEVAYEVSWPKALRRRGSTVRGSIRTSPEAALAAFRAGEGFLTFETGREYRVTLVGHADGSDTVYFELRA